MLYQLDLMLRGALFDFMEHTHRSVSPITINQNATTFVSYTLLFGMFVAIYIKKRTMMMSRRSRVPMGHPENVQSTVNRRRRPRLVPSRWSCALPGVGR